MDRHPIRQAALRERVVFGGAVLGTAVIPHEDIPHLPVMPIEEGRLGDELRQCLHEWHSLILRHAHDAYTCTGPDVQGFPSGHGMCPDDRMPNIREMVDSRGSVTAWSILSRTREVRGGIADEVNRLSGHCSAWEHIFPPHIFQVLLYERLNALMHGLLP